MRMDSVGGRTVQNPRMKMLRAEGRDSLAWKAASTARRLGSATNLPHRPLGTNVWPSIEEWSKSATGRTYKKAVDVAPMGAKGPCRRDFHPKRRASLKEEQKRPSAEHGRSMGDLRAVHRKVRRQMRFRNLVRTKSPPHWLRDFRSLKTNKSSGEDNSRHRREIARSSVPRQSEAWIAHCREGRECSPRRYASMPPRPPNCW
jgi:hypothetical protein